MRKTVHLRLLLSYKMVENFIKTNTKYDVMTTANTHTYKGIGRSAFNTQAIKAKIAKIPPVIVEKEVKRLFHNK